MGSNAQRRREARERVDQMRRQDETAARRRNMVFGVALIVVVALAVGGIAWAVKASTKDATASPSIAGLKTYDYKGGEHTTNDVHYTQTPPVGGEHDPQWQTCAFYDQPIRNENAVHSLEHGAVWVTYDPNLSKADIATLKSKVTGDYLLVSPYPGLPAPVVASAWNNQVQLDGVDDPRLEQFVTQFRNGPQTPEPGAPCTNGVTTTVTS
ncbi:MAG TPA: DUF3105 domain-containing protein [Actinomycetes bacterium]|nr:DUF3105 domain-containing protein [Actinomycetes bacterium]